MKRRVIEAAAVFAALLTGGVALVAIGVDIAGSDGQTMAYVGSGMIAGALVFFLLRMFDLGERLRG